MKTKARVRPEPHFANVVGNAKEATGRQAFAAGPSARIVRPQLGVPQKGGVGFQEQQRIVGAFALEARIVAHLGSLQAAKDGDHGAVQIQNQARAVLRLVNKLAQQPSIQTRRLLAKLGRRLQQEPAQSLRIGVAGRPRQLLETAVGPQEGRRFQTIRSQDDGIYQSQKHLRKLVALVAARILQMPRQETAQLQHSSEFVKQQNPAVVSQTRVIKGDSDVFR